MCTVSFSDRCGCALCVRRVEAQPGRTTERSSWPRRRNRFVLQSPLVTHTNLQLVFDIHHSGFGIPSLHSSRSCSCCLCLNPVSSGTSQRKAKGSKAASSPSSLTPCGARYTEGAVATSGGLTLRDPVTGAQYVQIQLLQVRSPDQDGTTISRAFKLLSAEGTQ